jgi:hypothetical protein
VVSQAVLGAAVILQVINAMLVGHDGNCVGVSAPPESLLVADALWSRGS